MRVLCWFCRGVSPWAPLFDLEGRLYSWAPTQGRPTDGFGANELNVRAVSVSARCAGLEKSEAEVL